MRKRVEMSPVILGLLVSWVAGCQPASTVKRTPEAVVEEVLRTTPLVDGHNDLVVHFVDCPTCPRELQDYDIGQLREGRTDIPRWKKGRLGAQLLNAGWITGEEDADGTLRGFDVITRLVEGHPDDLVLATTAADVRRAHADGKIAILLALENARRFQNSPVLVRQYARLGLRSNILAYNDPSDLADGGAGPARHGGLSELGHQIVREMNHTGVLIDLSHASDETAHDVLDISEAPVIFSHSSARALADVKRNVPDDVLLRLRDNGGIIMISFPADYTTTAAYEWYEAYYDAEEAFLDQLGTPLSEMAGWDWTQATADWYTRYRTYGRFVLDEPLVAELGERNRVQEAMEAWELEHPQPSVTVSDVADHFDYVRHLIGSDHIGIGSDFDGDPTVIEGLEDVSQYPNLLVELARRGWTEEDLRKVTGENFLRVLERAEHVAAQG